jgi:glycosyltransferase involved in cell wall biosynthesis
MDPDNRKQKLKILFIHNRYLQSTGGEDTTLDAEAALLSSKGHEVRIQLFDNNEMGKGILHKVRGGIKSVYNGKSARKTGAVIDDFKPDIVHVHNFYFTASPSVVIEAKRHKAPVVLTIQNYRLICANCLLLRDHKICELCVHHDFPWYGVKYKCYHNSAIQSAMVGAIGAIHKWIGTWRNKVDMILTPAAFIKNRLTDSSLNVDPQKIIVKHNFIKDPGSSPAEKRKRFYLFVGRLSEEKGVESLLKTWTTLAGTDLIIAGDGPDKNKLVERYGDVPGVKFVGKKAHEEILGLMKECRALIFPSIWYEGLPLTIIEALATGTPVIASNLGAMQEMIQDAENGFLFTAGNTAHLSEVIVKFNAIIDRQDFSLYKNARQTYISKYHPEKCYTDIMNIYNSVLTIGAGN